VLAFPLMPTPAELAALYASQPDAELLRLNETRDDLTDAAQEALAQVLRERGLQAPSLPVPFQPVPDSLPGNPLATPVDPDQLDQQIKEGEACLYVFDDAFQANAAIRVMNEAGIPHRMADWNKLRGEASASRYGFLLAMIVDRMELPRAAALLEEKLKLAVPVADGADQTAEPLNDLVVLAFYDHEEIAYALRAAGALANGGITFLWRDGRDSPEGLPNPDTIALEVRSSSLEQAQNLLDQAPS
jgi:hypothetical protein